MPMARFWMAELLCSLVRLLMPLKGKLFLLLLKLRVLWVFQWRFSPIISLLYGPLMVITGLVIGMVRQLPLLSVSFCGLLPISS
ncbi:hypothetical protein LINGRAHAP2_LOCUS5567 [Linum grandiflorum]